MPEAPWHVRGCSACTSRAPHSPLVRAQAAWTAGRGFNELAASAAVAAALSAAEQRALAPAVTAAAAVDRAAEVDRAAAGASRDQDARRLRHENRILREQRQELLKQVKRCALFSCVGRARLSGRCAGSLPTTTEPALRKR